MTVLIAGAGPTGLTAACVLMQRGVPVRVLDAAEPATTSRALGVQPRGGEVLDRVDALRDLPKRGMNIGFVKAVAGGRPLMTLRLAHMKGQGALIGQSEIEKSLRDRLSELGGKVEWARGHGYQADEDGVTRCGRAARSVATGCWAATARTAPSARLVGIDFQVCPLTETFPAGRRAHGLDRWARRRDHLARAGRRVRGVSVAGQGSWRLRATSPAPSRSMCRPSWRRCCPARTGLTAEITPATGRRRSRFTAAWPPTSTVAGRVFLAGDAAHVHSPPAARA